MTAASHNNTSTRSSQAELIILCCAFFISGFATLIYQVAWQRLLFTAIGVDTDSITLVVSVFMLGLGLGALLGGKLADARPRHIVLFFALAEFAIGIFGVTSPTLIPAVGATLAEASRGHTAAALYLLLAFPTLCMGATLPLLVVHVNNAIGNIGMSVGQLYFINTLGAALGAFAAGFVLLLFMDLHQAIYVAATANVMAGCIVSVGLRPRA